MRASSTCHRTTTRRHDWTATRARAVFWFGTRSD